MALNKEQVVETQEKQMAAVGLECLDDKTLADIVAADVQENGYIKSPEAIIAFKELARRSGHDV